MIDDYSNKNGIYTFTIVATLEDYPLMDDFITTTFASFTITITDVCTDEIITSPVISDMIFKIDLNPVPVVQDFPAYTDVYGEFCGRLTYTLSYYQGPLCAIWDENDDCFKSLKLIIMDGSIVTTDQSVYSHPIDRSGGISKLTINPTIEPLEIDNPYGGPEKYYDHTLFGEHEFTMSVNWIPNLPFAVPDVPTS